MIEARKTDVWSHLTKFDRLICMERHVARFPRPVLCGSLVDFNMSVVSASPTYFSVPLLCPPCSALTFPPSCSPPAEFFSPDALTAIENSSAERQRELQSIGPRLRALAPKCSPHFYCLLFKYPEQIGKEVYSRKREKGAKRSPASAGLSEGEGEVESLFRTPVGLLGAVVGRFLAAGYPWNPYLALWVPQFSLDLSWDLPSECFA
jgi:hypothetical protein